jgi:hypothetical protein
MNKDTPRTNRFYASFADGECIPNQDEWLALCESLESELTAVTEQRDKLIKAIEPLEYWRDISECDCSNPLPQGGCLRCDLERILKPTNPNEL